MKGNSDSRHTSYHQKLITVKAQIFPEIRCCIPMDGGIMKKYENIRPFLELRMV